MPSVRLSRMHIVCPTYTPQHCPYLPTPQEAMEEDVHGWLHMVENVRGWPRDHRSDIISCEDHELVGLGRDLFAQHAHHVGRRLRQGPDEVPSHAVVSPAHIVEEDIALILCSADQHITAQGTLRIVLVIEVDASRFVHWNRGITASHRWLVVATHWALKGQPTFQRSFASGAANPSAQRSERQPS